MSLITGAKLRGENYIWNSAWGEWGELPCKWGEVLERWGENAAFREKGREKMRKSREKTLIFAEKGREKTRNSKKDGKQIGNIGNPLSGFASCSLTSPNRNR